jgi:hypothetical protein
VAVYGLANLTTNVTAANAALELRTAATDRARLLQMIVTLNAATASIFGVGRPAAIGITPTSPITWLPYDPADPAGTAQTALAWATGPTVPVNFFIRINLPATIGVGSVLTFPTGLTIAISSALVLWNIATGSAANVSLMGEE